jgi:hypothetical protein
VLRYVLFAAAVLFAALGIAIAVTGGGSFSVGGIAVSSRTPQNALTAAWICAFIWLALTWRPRISWTPRSPIATRRALVIVSIVVATFIVGAAPLFKEAAYLIARGEYVTPSYGWRSAPRGIDVVAPLLGHPLHPLSRSASGRAYAAVSADTVEAVAWIGVMPLLIWLFTRGVRRGLEDARLWGAVGVVFLVWALGPYLLVGGFDTGLKLPQILARFLPFVANARMPGRAIVVVFMALAVLVAAGLARRATAPAAGDSVAAHRHRRIRVLGCADSPDAARSARGLSSARRSTAGGGVRGAVRHRRRVERRLRFAGSPHPLLRHPARASARRRLHRADAAAREGANRRHGSRGAAAATVLRPGRGRDATAAIASNPGQTCRYLVVNRAASPAAVLTYVQQLPAERIASDESRDLYRIRD